MKKKINLRLVAIALLAIIETMIGITIVYYGVFKEQIRNDLAVSAKLLKDTHYFESVNIDTDEIDLSTDMDELRVTWIDKDGTVLYDNDAAAPSLSNHSDRPEIRDAFKNGTAFIGFLTAGDPTIEKTVEYILAMDEAGCDLIEIGIPFSDPMAEGVVIQDANVRALKHNTTTDDVFEIVRASCECEN